jgi:uncharacterized protein
MPTVSAVMWVSAKVLVQGPMCNTLPIGPRRSPTSWRRLGLVLLVVPRQNSVPGTGHVRIEVGQGLEGIVTDATAGRIRRDVMGRLLAQERYGPALLGGVQALAAVIARGYGVADSTLTAFRLPPGGGGGARLPPWLARLLLVVGYPALGVLAIVVFLLRDLLPGARGGEGSSSSDGGWGGGGGFSGGGSGGRF